MEPLVTVAHLIHSITPQARIIATFRNPTERLSANVTNKYNRFQTYKLLDNS